MREKMMNNEKHFRVGTYIRTLTTFQVRMYHFTSF